MSVNFFLLLKQILIEICVCVSLCVYYLWENIFLLFCLLENNENIEKKNISRFNKPINTWPFSLLSINCPLMRGHFYVVRIFFLLIVVLIKYFFPRILFFYSKKWYSIIIFCAVYFGTIKYMANVHLGNKTVFDKHLHSTKPF